MIRLTETTKRVAAILLGAVAAGSVLYALMLAHVLPIRIYKKPVKAPEASAWVRALEQQVSLAEFEEIARTNSSGRDYALGLFANLAMTNHVRILVKHGADTSTQAMEALNFSGLSNAVSVIRGIVSESENSLPRNLPHQ